MIDEKILFFIAPIIVFVWFTKLKKDLGEKKKLYYGIQKEYFNHPFIRFDVILLGSCHCKAVKFEVLKRFKDY